MNFSPEKIEDIEKRVAFVARAGLKVVKIKPGYVKLSLPFKGNENHVDIMYAGALFTLAEAPGGVLYETAFDVSRYYPILKEMNISFRRPAKTDVTIEMSMPEAEIKRIESEATDKGKVDFILEGQIKDSSGEVVALSKGIYQMRTFVK